MGDERELRNEVLEKGIPSLQAELAVLRAERDALLARMETLEAVRTFTEELQTHERNYAPFLARDRDGRRLYEILSDLDSALSACPPAARAGAEEER